MQQHLNQPIVPVAAVGGPNAATYAGVAPNSSVTL